MTGGTIVALAGVAMALLLALRAVRSHRQPRRTLLIWAAVWIAVIAALAFVLQQGGLD